MEITTALSQLSTEQFKDVADCRDRITCWLTDSCIDDASKAEVAALIEAQDVKELRDRFYRELEFGTGGLRGIIGAGNNRMNCYVVRRATQGLANYISKQGQSAKTRGVAIAYDCRRFSDVFAREAASVLAANGISAHLFPTLNTTPCLSFAVRELGCIAGICVTASHNPPQYNGYKVYWEDGAQIIPPVDGGILQEVFAVTSFSQAKYLDFEEAQKNKTISYIPDTVVERYYQEVFKLRIYPDVPSDIKVVYTPLHGTGAVHAREVLKRWGFLDVHIVPEQEKPDGSFPTVKKPNPEEPAALNCAVRYAEKLDADIVTATDPDSDRIALVVREPKLSKTVFKHQALGDYVLLNGNQSGALMIDHLLTGLKQQGRLKKEHKIIKTIVTSELEARICKAADVEIVDTLTGFKWIAGVVRDWEVKGRKDCEYLFGTEESFGFMPGSYVRDKDGIASLCLVVEMANYLKAQKKTVCERLLEIFTEHGAWQESLINVDLVGEEGARRIKRMMTKMRENPWLEFAGLAVSGIRDFQEQKVFDVCSGKLKESSEKITLPVSDVLQFELAGGGRISMRPSGTEPKIKFYVSVCTKSTDGVVADYNTTLARLDALNQDIQRFVQSVQ